MASLSEQRAAVKFCILLGKNAAETVLMLNAAYKDDAMGKLVKEIVLVKNDDRPLTKYQRLSSSSV